MHTPLIAAEAPPYAVHAVFILAPKSIIMDTHLGILKLSLGIFRFLLNLSCIQTSFMCGVQPQPCIGENNTISIQCTTPLQGI